MQKFTMTGHTADGANSYFQTLDLLESMGDPTPFKSHGFLRCYLCRRRPEEQSVVFEHTPDGLSVEHRELKISTVSVETRVGITRSFPICDECYDLVLAIGVLASEEVQSGVSKPAQTGTEKG